MIEQQAPTYHVLSASEAEARFAEKVRNNYIGNDVAVDTIADVAVLAMQNDLRQFPTNGFILFGAASTGKTTLARSFAACVQTPYVESEANIKNADQLWEELKKVFIESERRVRLVEVAPRRYKVPPCVVFIDESHKLPDAGEWLLKPTEASDRTMILKDGSVVDTKYIFFILGTTKPDKLDSALLTRLREIWLRPYTTNEVAEMVAKKNAGVPVSERKRVAKMARLVPRVALAIANEATLHAQRAGLSIGEAIDVVSDRLGMDDNFLTAEQRKVLSLLAASGRLAKPRLAMAVNTTPDWLEQKVLPGLWQGGEEYPALVRMGARGVELTDEGEAIASSF